MAMEDILDPALEFLTTKVALTASVAALVVVLRYSRVRNLIQLTQDLSSVGTSEGEPDSPEHEFDVIIAGGGKSLSLPLL